MKIDRVKIENFKSLKYIDIPLENLNLIRIAFNINATLTLD